MNFGGDRNNIDYDIENLSKVFEISSDYRKWTFNIKVSWAGKLVTDSFSIDFTDEVLELLQKHSDGKINLEYLKALADQYYKILKIESIPDEVKSVISLYEERKHRGLYMLLVNLGYLKLVGPDDEEDWDEILEINSWNEKDVDRYLDNYLGRFYALSSTKFLSHYEWENEEQEVFSLEYYGIEDTQYIEDDKFIQTAMKSALWKAEDATDEYDAVNEKFLNMLDSKGWDLSNLHSTYSQFLEDNDVSFVQNTVTTYYACLEFAKLIFDFTSISKMSGPIKLQDNLWFYELGVYRDNDVDIPDEKVVPLILDFLEEYKKLEERQKEMMD
jgi:hypothetical protein